MADFRAVQRVRLFDGTNDIGFSSGNPFYTSGILSANDGVDIGDVTVNNAGGASAVNIQDGGNSITVDASNLDIRDLTAASDSVLIYANTAKDGSGTNYVPLVDADGKLIISNPSGVSAVDDSAFTIGTDSVVPMGALADETTPDSVNEGDVGIPRMTLDRKLLVRIVGATDANRLDVDASGYITSKINGVVSVDDNGGSLTVDGTVAATQSGTWNIGTVASITADVNIADGGNSITVDDGGTTLSIDDSGGSITVDGTVAVSSVSGTVTVSATDLDIRDLVHTQDSIKVGDGTSFISIDSGNLNVDLAAISVTAVPISKNGSVNSETNPIYVHNVDTVVSGVEVHDFDIAATVAKDGTDNHDYTVTGTTFLLKSVIVAASGAGKYEIQVGPVASLVTKAVAFTSASRPTEQLVFDPPIEVPVTSTGTVRIIRRNDDNQSMDMYSTIIGSDV